jgi:hypothetical protein
MSCSSQDFLQTPVQRQIPIKSSEDTPSVTKANTVKCFQRDYLEFGLWPDMSQESQHQLKTKYKELKSSKIQSELKQVQLQQELKKAAEQPCMNCILEKSKHQATKKALEEAVALSNLLLKKIVEMDSDVGRHNSDSAQ